MNVIGQPGLDYATAGFKTSDNQPIFIFPDKYQSLWHGTDQHVPESVRSSGLPRKGADIDLINHVEQRNDGSAFRGTTEILLSYDANSGAVLWADIGGWVYQIEDFKGYDVANKLEGRIPNGHGGFRNPLMKEIEIAVYAEVPRANIRKYAIIEESLNRPGHPKPILRRF